MPDLVARGAANPQTIREHLEAIRLRTERYRFDTGDPSADDWRDAVAALDLVDNAKIQMPMMVATGMDDIEFIDDAYTPEGAAIYRDANRHRLVPDPAPRGDAEPNDDKIRKLYGPGTQGSVS